jgi:hypothetical protein
VVEAVGAVVEEARLPRRLSIPEDVQLLTLFIIFQIRVFAMSAAPIKNVWAHFQLCHFIAIPAVRKLVLKIDVIYKFYNFA